MKPSNRIANLDFYRFLAITLVIYYHVGERFTLHWAVAIGKYGVELFFVLSGFLIADIYYRKSDGNLARFWLQRFLRTYPPYLVALALSYSAVFVSRSEPFDPGFLFFFQNFYSVIPFFKISWSLCIEEHFYLVFPLIVLLLAKVPRRNLYLALWIAVTLTPTLIRYYEGNFAIGEFGYFHTATIFRFDGIALGCTIAYVFNHYKFSVRPGTYASIISTALFIGMAYWLTDLDSRLKYSLGYFLLVCSAGMLLICFFHAPVFVFSKLNFVRRVAWMAYSLYLTHALVLNLFDRLFHQFPAYALFVTLPACMLAIYLAGLAFYKTVEQPSISLRDNILNYRARFRRSSG
ncbi:Peptidoglycan/LPS O-acetylase OafA/YrhL, contains acyltransferase and SGNH-hydrolase domains [Dyadobacter sp. SG02]|uniref:acyltransferase family protein n=1 Tax=Dyadobacter sp. SG02 TaxID=1855291 RepID=UPI0008C19EF1|nr:acyltransferase [Dyadobacter sp. SG02]SEJ39238.1 Peptidoglycan/LPS O-acetylase OafA/YrhL, contains acyltransferase and SGNH-hydrolase domains [Dyadobacter sp. SG02]